ncbi:uncharacterized protein LOC124446226 [Xenia sp. Carnegie-2017]|uniref:uncharacterized protein LOC124446226 n=1 Tax=Xenia sp. Carnegie-2017 TaxID=2897299 RepID=UPI001F03D5E4|nr:uncharacterized protein LOC124446226 [Xenia sp. Carnegie-2017]XP_046853006.1 uncharacterized protein LOC124446226 [Xenia sp. Carnegie-2017]
MKTGFNELSTQQFHLKIAQRRPKSCFVKNTGSKENFPSNHVQKCRSEQNAVLSPSFSSSKGYVLFNLSADIEKMDNTIKSQQIQISSYLRRPHASCYTLLDSQCIPETAKPCRPPYHPKSASTVFGYAKRPVSASEVSHHLGRQTKTSLLRSKSKRDMHTESCNSQSFRNIRNQKPRVIRGDSRITKSSLTPKEVLDYMKSAHAYLTGARYNSSHVLDSKSQSRYGVYVSKEKLRSCKTNKITVSSEKEIDEQLLLALKIVDSKTSKADVVNVATNTEPHYLSFDDCNNSKWNKLKKPLPRKDTDSKFPVAKASVVKCIQTMYIDYDSVLK